jgi:hypothetical protein
MSRTEEDIQSRVGITIMRHPTLRAYPASYSEICDTFRPRLARARRTDSGRERFIDFLVPGPVRSRFVAEHASEGRPARIENGLCKAGLGKSGGVYIADRDVVELSNDADRDFVAKVTTRMSDTRVKIPRLRSFTGALRGSQFVGQSRKMSRVFDLLARGQGREVFKTQVDPNTAAHRPRDGLGDFNDDVQEPMTARIAGEIRSVPDRSVRQRPRVEHPKGVSGIPKGIPLALKIPTFQRHPAQRPPAAPPQERSVPLAPRLRVLFAHRIDGARVQGEMLAASRAQPVEIKAAWPDLVPFQRLLLSLIAEIPDEVTSARLPVQHSGQRLDAVSIDQQHQRKLMRLKDKGKTPKLDETSIFAEPRETLRAHKPHCLPGACARVSMRESR